MKEILDSLGEGVFTVDKEFRITFLNRAAERMLGVKREEAVGRFCKHVLKSHYCLDQCPIARVPESRENLYDRLWKVLRIRHSMRGWNLDEGQLSRNSKAVVDEGHGLVCHPGRRAARRTGWDYFMRDILRVVEYDPACMREK